MASSLVQFRIDDTLKAQATELFDNLGLDLPTALRMFLKRSVMERGIPFSMSMDPVNKEHRDIHAEHAVGMHKEEKTAIHEYDSESGMPTDRSHYEKGLPPFLQKSLDQMKKVWEALDRGETPSCWDMDWSELNADINWAEQDQLISPEQADWLRKKWLRMEDE